MSFDWILHGRYMGPSDFRGNRAYGGEDVSSTCLGRAEFLTVPRSLDVSRSLNYFFSGDTQYLSGTGMTGALEDGSVNKQAINRVVHFMNNVYALFGDKIYIYDEALKTWSVSLSLTGKTGTESNSIGLYPVFVGNVPTLITAWNTTGSTWQSAKLNGITNTWSLGSVGTVLDPNDANGGILNEAQHKNKIYFIDSSTANIGWYDFLYDRFGTIAWASTVRHPMDFATYMGELYCLNKDDSRNINLHRIDVDSTVLVGNPVFLRSGTSGPDGENINAALSKTDNYEARNMLFTDNVRVDSSGLPVLWAFNMAHTDTEGTSESDHGVVYTALALDAGGNFTGAHGFTPNGSFISNPFKMMPNQIGAGEEFIAKPEELTMRCYIDQRERELAPSNVSDINCATRFGGYCGGADAGAGHKYAGGGGDFNYLINWKWLGGGAPGFPLGIFGGTNSWNFLNGIKEARHRAFPHDKIGGGSRSSVILNDGNKNIDLIFRGTDTTNKDGIMRIFYNLITTPGVPNGTNVAVKWYYDGSLHAPEAQCKPTGTSAGSVSDLEVVSIPADSGSLYWFDWDVKFNSLPYGTLINLNGVVVANEVQTTALTDPTDLGGLTLWLEADDSSTIDSGGGGEVLEWRDKSGGVLVSGVSQSQILAHPFVSVGANNGLDGIRFTASSGHFLFSSGSPIEHEGHTTFVIYEASSFTPVGERRTIFSMSNDVALNTWGGTGGVGAPSGTIVGSGEFYSVETSGNENSILISSQDHFRANEGVDSRDLGVISGAIPNLAKLIYWKEEPFISVANIHPPSGIKVSVDINTDGMVTPSGMVDASGVSFGNTTVGRFSGGHSSGVYIDAGKYFDGIVYEIATYNRVLFDLEVERFVLYASGKYDLK